VISPKTPAKELSFFWLAVEFNAVLKLAGQ